MLTPSGLIEAKAIQGSPNYSEDMENIVKKALDKSGTPGASVAIVSKDGIVIESYGYADKESNSPVTKDTLFELGSMSKAFTGLGILYLEQEGQIDLKDDIKEYLPWLNFEYVGTHKGHEINGEVKVTVRDLLYQTSGIPFKTIGYIPEGNTEEMLEKTVRSLNGTQLDFYPGTKFSYTTVNYDVLGLIIETVSGVSYEKFITENILIPLGLNQTYLYRQEALDTGKYAAGYKTEFFRTTKYKAPEYRGNTPAGYVISSGADMARWLQIQMGLVELPDKYVQILKNSHIGNSMVAADGDYYYAAGWNVHIRGETLTHGGSNPNFSSMIMIDKEKELGICVLTNQNSNAAGYIADNFFNTIYNQKITKYEDDVYKNLDNIFTVLFIAFLILGIVFLILFILSVVEIILKRRNREKIKKGKVAGIFLAIPIMIFFGYCIYYLPNILLQRLPWEAVNVWGSRSISFGCFSGFLAGIIFFCYVLLTFNFPKAKEKNYCALIPLSILNGLASALIIFTINESFNRNLAYSRELLVYFIFALTFFIYTIKLVQGRMIMITNEIAYEKRVVITEKIIQTPYEIIEKIGSSRIYSGLNNDANAVSQLPGLIVSIASNVLTLLFCLVYLLSNSVEAFLASACVIILNCFISFLTGKIASKYWEKNRDVQDVYFGLISDLVYGFKELVLNKNRKKAFGEEINKYSKLSSELSKEASIKFLNFGLYNTLMYNIIFGVVVFVFPLIIIGISVNELRENLFMVFYLIGPFGSLMSAIPNLTQVRVNLKRIDKLIQDLDKYSQPVIEDLTEATKLEKVFSLKLNQVSYEYKSDNQDSEQSEVEFILGPINAEINSGEITYIIGGNGSGKSTLGKLISGLYSPKSGSILINEKLFSTAALNDCFSAVYSDFYLFKKLYGIDINKQMVEIQELLKALRIDEKVEINEHGELKSLNLSTGQKKRLAFLICCLDNKPFMLFDEWAAEQDPEFRAYFYDVLLPKLRQKGKGVIVITHDDRFFNLADNIIKLERGKVVPVIS
jgi:cyclic peptide transporter